MISKNNLQRFASLTALLAALIASGLFSLYEAFSFYLRKLSLGSRYISFFFILWGLGFFIAALFAIGGGNILANKIYKKGEICSVGKVFIFGLLLGALSGVILAFFVLLWLSSVYNELA
jgi:hypothetical protein